MLVCDEWECVLMAVTVSLSGIIDSPVMVGRGGGGGAGVPLAEENNKNC